MFLRRGRTYGSVDSPQRRSSSADDARNIIGVQQPVSDSISRAGAMPVIRSVHDTHADGIDNVSNVIQRSPDNGFRAADSHRPRVFTDVELVNPRPPSRDGAAMNPHPPSWDGAALNVCPPSRDGAAMNVRPRLSDGAALRDTTEVSPSEAECRSISGAYVGQASSPSSLHRNSGLSSARTSHASEGGFVHSQDNNYMNKKFSQSISSKDSPDVSREDNPAISLRHTDEVEIGEDQLNSAYAKMMLEIINGMNNEEEKERILLRARRMAKLSAIENSRTTTGTRTLDDCTSVMPCASLHFENSAHIADPVQIAEENKLEMPFLEQLKFTNRNNSLRNLTRHQIEQVPRSSYLSQMNDNGDLALTLPNATRFSQGFTNRGVKLPPPAKYDGSADFDCFENFVYEVNTYYEWAGLSSPEQVRHVQSLLTGKAARFYMLNVARRPSEWTMPRFSKELFAYCFPRNFLEIIRNNFDKIKQNKLPFLDFVREIEKMANRVSDVSEHQKCQRLFNGANGYLRIGWRQRGMNAENSLFEDLQDSGLDIESTAMQMVYEGRRTRTSHQRIFDYLGDCPSIEKVTNTTRTRIDELSDNYDSDLPDQAGNSENEFQTRKLHGRGNPRLTHGEIDKLMATGACFLCKERGHRAKECPEEERSQHPPRITAAAVHIGRTEIETLAARIDARQNEELILMTADVSVSPVVLPIRMESKMNLPVARRGRC